MGNRIPLSSHPPTFSYPNGSGVGAGVGGGIGGGAGNDVGKQSDIS